MTTTAQSESHVQPPGNPNDAPDEAFRLDGRLPDRVLAPASEEEAVEAIRWAATERCALVPWGGGTAIEQGNRLRAERWAALSTARLAAKPSFSPDDMMVTAPAGLPLADLQSVLATEKQYLPIDAPFPRTATIGGIAATNAQGLWRPLFGTPRDRLLEVRVVMADGSVVRGGGKVVKNVAGYDLCKLFAGSWGTLGLIVELTFKTNPLPERQEHIVFGATSIRAAIEAAHQVHAARLQPAYLTAVNGERAVLCVGLMGSAQAVAWQRQQIGAALTDAGLNETDSAPEPESMREAVAGSGAPIAARATVRPTDLPAFAESLVARTGQLVCHVPTGVVEMKLPAPPTDAPPRSVLDAIRAAIPPGGHLVWTRLPDDWKTDIDVWGPTRGDFALMKGIKSALDPTALFSPGRFVGRL